MIKKIFDQRKLLKIVPTISEIHEIKYIKIDKVHIYMCLNIASNKSTAGNKTRLLTSLSFISTSWFFILAEAFLNDHVAACSTNLRSATEKNEMGGYVTIPCSSKMTQRSSTADWPKFW